MSIVCCGVKYSKKDIDTYLCIESGINIPVQKKYVGNEKVSKEVVDNVICKKCGCNIVEISRFGKLRGNYKLLERERLSGIRAVEYLEETKEIRQRQRLSCPIKRVKYAKHIDLCYGKSISATKQRARYVNDLGWGSSEIYEAIPTCKKL